MIMKVYRRSFRQFLLLSGIALTIAAVELLVIWDHDQTTRLAGFALALIGAGLASASSRLRRKPGSEPNPTWDAGPTGFKQIASTRFGSLALATFAAGGFCVAVLGGLVQFDIYSFTLVAAALPVLPSAFVIVGTGGVLEYRRVRRSFGRQPLI